MSKGRIVEHGPVAEVFTNPQSQYTRELISAIPGQTAAKSSRRPDAHSGFADTA